MASGRRHFFIGAVLSSFLVASASAFGQVDSIGFQQVLTHLQDKDPRVVSENAGKLSGYPFLESEQALLNTLQKQLNDPSKINTFVVSAIVDSLEAIGTASSVAPLTALQTQLSGFPPSPKLNKRSREILTSRMGEALTSMQARTANLPSGLSAPPAVPAQSRPPAAASAPAPSRPQAQLNVNGAVRQFLLNGVVHDFVGDVIRKEALTGDEAAQVVFQSTIEFLTDSVLEGLATQNVFQICGRDAEAKDVLRTLVRMKGKNPVLVGAAGAGKSTVAMKVAQLIATELPDQDLYSDLKGAAVIETTPARISRLAKSNGDSSQASAIELFFDSVLKVEKRIGHPIVVFVDELHTLSEAQIEAMKPYLDSRSRAIRLIGATTSREYAMAFKHNEAIKRRFQLIDVKEFSVEETLEIVKRTWQDQVESRFHAKFSSDAIEAVVRNALTLLPENGSFDASIKIMQDVAIAESESKTGQADIVIDKSKVNSFLQRKLGYPVDPADAKAMQEYRKGLLSGLTSDVLFQPNMIESTVDLWMDLLGDGERGVRVQALLGPTGTGKSELGRSLAKRVFKRDGAFLEIDANTFKTGGLAFNSLIGAPNGVVSSDKTSGLLMDYLDDPARGKFGGIILINEAERMPQEAWERLMEMLDIGEIAGGDGRTRKLKRHLIILTSNRIDKTVFPERIERLSPSELDAYVSSFDNDKLREAYKQKASGKDEFILPDAIIARIDSWSLAKPITSEMAKGIADKAIRKTVEGLNQRFGRKIELGNSVANVIAERTFQYSMGARPVIKAAQGLVQKVVTLALGNLDLKPDAALSIGVSDGQLYAQSPDGQKSQIALPRSPSQDPLDDPMFAERMRKLESDLNQSVIGQPEATHSVAQAVIAHQSDVAASKRPMAMFLAGSTGNGKTSMARALAKSLYASEERAEVIDLGKVNFEGALNDVFGSRKGYVGSLERSQFEEILIRNPNGGVIVFDEASNMGGEDRSIKSGLFKQGFYSLIEEGQWISSATGKTYSLSNFTFIFTGNDGETLFRGIHSDVEKMNRYRRYKDRAKILSLLVDAGVPEAFLGRMIDVILMKPLLKSDIETITETMLKKTLESYEQRGLRFDISDGFSRSVAQAFFSDDQGARSIRSFFDSPFKAALANLIVQAGGLKAIGDQRLRITIDDNRSPRPYFSPAADPHAVVLKIDLIDSSQRVTQTFTSDVTARAEARTKRSFTEVKLKALREVARAVVNSALNTGERLSYISVEPEVFNDRQNAIYEPIREASTVLTRASLVARIAALMAGSRALQIDGQPPDTGGANELKAARDLLARSLRDFGLDSDVESALVQNDGPFFSSEQDRSAAGVAKDIMGEAARLARTVLIDRWQLVRDLTAQLLKRGSISGDEFQEALKSHAGLLPDSLDLTVLRERRQRACLSIY